MPGPSRRCLLLLAVLVSGCTGLGSPAGGAGSPTAAATLAPIASVAATLTPIPSTSSTAAPTPTPDPGLLELEAIGCEGGVVLDWSASTHPDFHHYTALRSPEREIAPDYPPIAPAVDWGDTYATDRFVTSAVDASILPSETSWNYRVMAYDAAGRVVSASPVRAARLSEPIDLGELRVSASLDGATRLEWQPYPGLAGCFSSYQVLSGVGGPPTTVLSVVSDQRAATFETDALHPAIAYQLRVAAVRVTTLGSFVAGQTEIASVAIP